MSERNLIVNADDLGASDGVNRGIAEAHVRGIVTSASLMVYGPAAAAAAALSAEHPDLSIGLHWDLDSRGDEHAPPHGAKAVRSELELQVDAFREITGRDPTHLDSHHHVHRDPEVLPHARELAGSLGLPLREEAPVTYVGGFYGQWEWQVTDLSHVSVDFLTWILRNEVGEGWTEIGCHPGWITPDLESTYLHEREEEVRTLTHPRVPHELDALGIRLRSYAEL